MLPHAHVHGRHHQDRLVRGEQHGGGKVIGEARIGLGHQICGGGADDDQIGRARELDMAHLGFFIEVEQFGIGLVAGERGDGKRRDEFLSGLGHDAAARNAATAKFADQLEALIGRDAAADDEENAFLFHGLQIGCWRCLTAKSLQKPHKSP